MLGHDYQEGLHFFVNAGQLFVGTQFLPCVWSPPKWLLISDAFRFEIVLLARLSPDFFRVICFFILFDYLLFSFTDLTGQRTVRQGCLSIA